MPAERWIKRLPRSKMVYPSGVRDRLKYWFWVVYTPLHPYVRNIGELVGINAHRFSTLDNGRQDFLFGILRPECSVYDFISYLVSQGFGNHFVAWRDSDEIISLRKPTSFEYQYHIRVFSDGEVRCHYEYTPEYRPLQHLLQIGFEERRDEFESLLQGWTLSPYSLRETNEIVGVNIPS